MIFEKIKLKTPPNCTNIEKKAYTQLSLKFTREYMGVQNIFFSKDEKSF